MMKNILLVDDQKTFIDGLSKALNRYCDFHGDIRAVNDGESAIEEVASNFYDLCFLDIKLPGMDGLDVMDKIHDISPETRVVIMSGSYLDADMQQRINDRASMFISKPVDLNVIKDYIERESVIGEGSGGQQGRH